MAPGWSLVGNGARRRRDDSGGPADAWRQFGGGVQWTGRERGARHWHGRGIGRSGETPTRAGWGAGPTRSTPLAVQLLAVSCEWRRDGADQLLGLAEQEPGPVREHAGATGAPAQRLRERAAATELDAPVGVSAAGRWGDLERGCRWERLVGSRSARGLCGSCSRPDPVGRGGLTGGVRSAPTPSPPRPRASSPVIGAERCVCSPSRTGVWEPTTSRRPAQGSPDGGRGGT